MPKKISKEHTASDDINMEGFEDDEPIPARRDTRIFQRDKDGKEDKDEDFEEDVFV